MLLLLEVGRGPSRPMRIPYLEFESQSNLERGNAWQSFTPMAVPGWGWSPVTWAPPHPWPDLVAPSFGSQALLPPSPSVRLIFSPPHSQFSDKNLFFFVVRLSSCFLQPKYSNTLSIWLRSEIQSVGCLEVVHKEPLTFSVM